MACKYIYIGQKWTSSDLKIGKGSIYLSGPRNRRGKSWRVDAINKIANAVEATLLIPEGANQLKGGFCRVDKEEKNRWQKFAIGSAAAIAFWYPKDAVDDLGPIDLEAWANSAKVFIGKDPQNQTPTITKLAETHPHVTISDSLEGLVERLTNWLNRE